MEKYYICKNVGSCYKIQMNTYSYLLNKSTIAFSTGLIFLSLLPGTLFAYTSTDATEAISSASNEVNSEFWTQDIHCPDITDSVLKFGMKDSRKDKRISDFQLFLADYYGLEKDAIVTGRFDKITQDYVIRLHKESGLKQKFVDQETRGIVNVRCRYAGIRPRIGSFSSSVSTIKKGDSAWLEYSVENANSCDVLNRTEARDPDAVEWLEGGMSFDERRPGGINIYLRVRPLETTVYELFCSYDYPEGHLVGGTTQSMKHLTITVR